MKKFSGKFILSALLVSAMVCSTAVASSAADYAETVATTTAAPGGVGPTAAFIPGATSSADTTAQEETPVPVDMGIPADVAALITGFSVENIVSVSEDVIELEIAPSASGKITVQEAAIAAIKASGKTVVLINKKDGYSITIDPALIEEPKQLNLAVAINSSSKATKKDGVEIPANSIVIKPAQKGEFGLTLQITFDLGDDLDPDNLYLFYINDDGEIEDYTDDLSVDGEEVTISISHSSEYVITDEDISSEEEDENEVVDDTPIDDEPDIDIDVDDEPDAQVDDEQEDTAKQETPSDTTGGVIIDGQSTDANPITGTSIVFGTLAVTALSAAAIAVTSKKRK
jgi:hypothetical protein